MEYLGFFDHSSACRVPCAAGDLQRATNARVQVENLGPEGAGIWCGVDFFGDMNGAK